ncbi:MAG: hypothetical protein A3F70_05805 [Acidobacteria bacterium RIFCSPLOWO2_12_FULL_67_14]|nr:MAG: hypothetical protein A3H29_13305 [Acidobacteria bacterium RIFCSPLOWO2_02_FULL_67_21]OFW41122.1 MAG: hypothetical protein A3F70_05805 [Acidobacteria bacterium RIFCSPLOWO2_12_FULL_67_14]
MTGRVVLAYSGAPRGAASIRALAAGHAGGVVALVLDLGQGVDLEEAHARALDAGAARAHVVDVRDTLAREFILPALHAGVRADTGDAMAIALARPLIARTLVDIAHMEAAAAVAHGGTDAGRAQLDTALRALDPALRILPPAADAPGTGVPTVRATLWGRLIEYAPAGTEGPAESLYWWTRRKAAAPASAAHVEIGFDAGVPTTINAVSLPLIELIESLSIIAGQHGIGRIVDVNGRPGAPHRAHEVPAAVVLQAAHGALEAAATGEARARATRDRNAPYAGLVLSGHWFSPARASLDAFNHEVQKQVTGSVQIEFVKGELAILACRPAVPSEAPAALPAS